ncbi:Translation initiation factor IF-3 [Phycisphaerae bacterium RAS2]|nr:Translation initiation factor IF-3 [Phycisphaerae bacterium RAS2]
MAREAGLDLVEVSPNERPPVCKIMDYGKHKYLLSKKQKHKHHEQKMKEVRIRPKTDPHDRKIKLEHAREFLSRGDKVQFTMIFKGRERFHQEIGQESFNEIAAGLTDVGKVERDAKMLGRKMTMIMIPLKVPTPGKPVGSKPVGSKSAGSKSDGKPKPPKPTAKPAEGSAEAGSAAMGTATPDPVSPPAPNPAATTTGS